MLVFLQENDSQYENIKAAHMHQKLESARSKENFNLLKSTVLESLKNPHEKEKNKDLMNRALKSVLIVDNNC